MILSVISDSLGLLSEDFMSEIKMRSFSYAIDSNIRLPHVPRPRMSICILADAADIDRAKQIELEYMSVDDLKK